MLTVREAAEKLGVSAGLVYGLCAAGQLRHERFGLGRGTIRISDEALGEYRNRQTVGVRSKPGRSAPLVKLKHLHV